MGSDTDVRFFPQKRLESFVAAALAALGLPEKDAALCAARMIDADLRGVDTQGIFRLNHYSQRIRAGGSTCTRKCIPSGKTQ